MGNGYGAGRPIGVHGEDRSQHRGVLVPGPIRLPSGCLLHDIELGGGQLQVGLHLLQRASQGDGAGVPAAGRLGHRRDQDPFELLGHVASSDWGDRSVEHSVQHRELVVAVGAGDVNVGRASRQQRVDGCRQGIDVRGWRQTLLVELLLG